MNYLYQQRGTGKTSYLIHASAKTQIPIAVATVQQVRMIKEKAKDFGLTIPEPFIANRENCERAGKYFIDEAGMVLHHLLSGEPVLASLSEEGDFLTNYVDKYY